MANKILYTDKEYLINDTTIPDKNKVLDIDMNEIKQVVNNNADELDTATGNISNLQGQVDTNTNDITNIKQEQTTQNNKITSLETDNTTNKSNISNLQGRVASSETAISNLQRDKADKSEIPTDLSQLSNETTKFTNETQLSNAVATETTARQNADNNLQSQIDAITVSSDVIDVLGTYQDLLNYDTQHVKMNDLIKVLQDSTHENAMTYYRWRGRWTYVGSEGPYYTKSEADGLLQGKVDNTDFNALESTVIGQGQDIVENTSDITVLKGKVSAIETEQTTQNTNIQTNANNITALGNRVSTNETDISNIKTEQTTQNEEIAALKQETKDLRNASYKIYTETPSTNVTLNKTSKNKFIKFGVNGNREQTTYEGYNLLPILDIAETTQRGITYSASNGEIKLNGTATGGNVAIVLTTDLGLTTTESITVVRNSNQPNDMTPGIYITIDGTEYNTQNQSTHRDYRTLNAGTVSQVRIYITEGTTLNNVTTKPMIYLGEYDSTKVWEPYTYGQAPNPNYECPINAVGDNGVVNIEKCNKNWFDSNFAQGGINSRGNNVASTTRIRSNFIRVIENKEFVFSAVGNNLRCAVFQYDKDQNFISQTSSGWSSLPYTFTTDEKVAYIKILVSFTTDAEITPSNITNPQLELGTTATPYIPHEEEVFNMPCQKPMPGQEDYFDWDNEKEVHGWTKLILDGTESWTYTSGIFYIIINNFATRNNIPICNKYKGISNVANVSVMTVNNTIAVPSTTDLRRLYIKDNRFDNVEDFKADLAQNNCVVYYKLRESQIEKLPFTTEQKAVAEQIENSTSYYEQTNVYSNDNVSPIYDITAVGDQNLVIDSIDARLSLVE